MCIKRRYALVNTTDKRVHRTKICFAHHATAASTFFFTSKNMRSRWLSWLLTASIQSVHGSKPKWNYIFLLTTMGRWRCRNVWKTIIILFTVLLKNIQRKKKQKNHSISEKFCSDRRNFIAVSFIRIIILLLFLPKKFSKRKTICLWIILFCVVRTSHHMICWNGKEKMKNEHE